MTVSLQHEPMGKRAQCSGCGWKARAARHTVDAALEDGRAHRCPPVPGCDCPDSIACVLAFRCLRMDEVIGVATEHSIQDPFTDEITVTVQL